ncbi:MAG TPA: hypothetical protein VMZ31_10135 [Phycisphaerae bacterium]|nr:hypothetical protein [Phycisphaerae bacterium]
MSSRNRARRIKQVRNEILVLLKMLYPSALQAEVMLRSLLAIFPQLEWDHFRKDLVYLHEKGYVRQVNWPDAAAEGVSWRQRWFRLTPEGVEVADHCVADPALEV